MATYDEIRIVLRTLAYDMDFRVPDGISKGITAMAALAELGASKTGFMSYYDLSEALDIPKPAVTKAGRVLHQARLAKSVNPGGIRGLSITCDGYVLLEMTNNRVRGVGRQAEPVEGGIGIHGMNKTLTELMKHFAPYADGKVFNMTLVTAFVAVCDEGGAASFSRLAEIIPVNASTVYRAGEKLAFLGLVKRARVGGLAGIQLTTDGEALLRRITGSDGDDGQII